jgi:hypothetical protein
MQRNVVHAKIGRELVKVVLIYTLVISVLAYISMCSGGKHY